MATSDVIAFAPVLTDRRTMSEHVAESLRAAIRHGELPAGSELNQIALAEQFGVSRGPVREAMRQLQAEGWIDARAHQRAVVRAISPARIIEILELRALLEEFLIERTVPKMTPAALAVLERRCDEMSATTDHQRWLELNRAFHRDLYESSGMQTTTELVEQLGAQVERYVRAHGESIAREREAVDEHRAIVRAVAERDVATARRLARQHIEHTLERFRATTASHHPAEGED